MDKTLFFIYVNAQSQEQQAQVHTLPQAHALPKAAHRFSRVTHQSIEGLFRSDTTKLYIKQPVVTCPSPDIIIFRQPDGSLYGCREVVTSRKWEFVMK